jgi:hypothetical protein
LLYHTKLYLRHIEKIIKLIPLLIAGFYFTSALYGLIFYRFFEINYFNYCSFNDILNNLIVDIALSIFSGIAYFSLSSILYYYTYKKENENLRIKYPIISLIIITVFFLVFLFYLSTKIAFLLIFSIIFTSVGLVMSGFLTSLIHFHKGETDEDKLKLIPRAVLGLFIGMLLFEPTIAVLQAQLFLNSGGRNPVDICFVSSDSTSELINKNLFGQCEKYLFILEDSSDQVKIITREHVKSITFLDKINR